MILLLSVLISIAAIVFDIIYCKITKRSLSDNQTFFTVLPSVITFSMLIIMFISNAAIKENLSKYEKRVQDIQVIDTIDCNVSNQKFINFLHSFVDLEEDIKSDKEINKSFWIEVFIPDAVDDFELYGQNLILNKCKDKLEERPLHIEIERCEPMSCQPKGESNE